MEKLTTKEYEAIVQLNSEYRQAMFMRVCAEAKGLYLLVDDEGPLILEDTEEDDDNNIYSIIPVWCYEELARNYAQINGHEKMHSQFVTKDAWNEKWLPMLKSQPNVLIGFMPVKDKDFAVEDPFAI